MKYILVSGGVISGIGKGVITSSIGALLKSNGLSVTAIKIDPYLNIDAGNFSPCEHGEVYVLADGGEVGSDLGNYERFFDVTLHRDNNITTGKIYQQVISKERQGDYTGKTVQVVPHVTNAIMEWIERVSTIPTNGHMQEPEVCVIELGGTIGDIEGMPFVEAFRQFQFRVGVENFCNLHVSLVPQMRSTGEQKTKPTQHSVWTLRSLGLSPDLILCRSQTPIVQEVKEKISSFCHVSPEQVIAVQDVSSIYHVPSILEEQNLSSYFVKRLGLSIKQDLNSFLASWNKVAEIYDKSQTVCRIALVGNYSKIDEAYTSVIEALKHACCSADRKLKLTMIEATQLEKSVKECNRVAFDNSWKELRSSDGILVPGEFGSSGVEGKIAAVKWARLNKHPFLGVGLGFHVAAIEFARNVLNLEGAHSIEFDPLTSHKIVIKNPEANSGKQATMILGRRRTMLKPKNSVLKKLYHATQGYVDERHRHRYILNPYYVNGFEERGFSFIGEDAEKKRMDIMELKDYLMCDPDEKVEAVAHSHPYFVGVQFYPEFTSRPLHPSPPYLGLVLAACGELESWVAADTVSKK